MRTSAGHDASSRTSSKRERVQQSHASLRPCDVASARYSSTRRPGGGGVPACVPPASSSSSAAAGASDWYQRATHQDMRVTQSPPL
jgi:hypothetical protein